MAADFDAGSIEASLELDRDPFQEGLRLARKQADEFRREKFTATADLDARLAEGHAKAARGRIDETFKRNVHAELELDTGKADEKLAVTDAAVRKVKRDARDAAGAGGLGAIATAVLALAPAALPVLGVLGAGAGALAAGFTAAGAGAIGFGVVAKGAFKGIEDAQKRILAAQKQYTAATTDKARAAALLKEKQAWDSLTPSQQAAATALEGLEGTFHRVERALQPVVLSALVPWLQAAREGIGFLSPLVSSAAGAIGTLGREARIALAGPFWHHFFADLSNSSGLLLASMGRTIGNVLHGIAGIVEAFLPMSVRLSGGIADLSAKFAAWGEHLGTSSAFHKFIAYVQQVGPQVGHTIVDLAKAAGKVLVAMAPLGPPILQVVDAIAKLVAQHPQIVAFGLVALGWFSILNKGVGAAVKFVGSIGKIIGAFKEFGKAMRIVGAFVAANPIIAIATGIAIAAALIIKYHKQIWAIIQRVWHDVVHAVSIAWNAVWGVLKKWGPVALAVLAPFIGIPLLIWQHWSQIEHFIARALGSAWRTIHRWVGDVVHFFESIPGRIGHALLGLANMIADPFRKGLGLAVRAWNDTFGHLPGLHIGGGSWADLPIGGGPLAGGPAPSFRSSGGNAPSSRSGDLPSRGVVNSSDVVTALSHLIGKVDTLIATTARVGPQVGDALNGAANRGRFLAHTTVTR